MRFRPSTKWIDTYHFFVTVGKLTWTNVSDCVHVPWPRHKRRHAKSKLTQNEALTVKL